MIETRGLVKRYGATAAVNDLSFTVRPGLVTGFLGPHLPRRRAGVSRQLAGPTPGGERLLVAGG
jgi:ABC-2 type transport system ATP-binding protein